MKNTVISVENLTKQYDLGVIGTGTISRDLERWWARVRKQPDPYSTIGQKDAFERAGESILALDNVSFKVDQGEALGIIGRNGAGKSTLLKILSRVTAPTSGVVKVKGRIGSLLEVGTGFHPELTGRENVYLNGAILGMRKDEVTRKFDEIVAFSGVERFIDTPVKRYSSGMYVRLAFAVAAHLDPEILIVDEVLAVGDAEFQKKCLGKMGDVAGEGRTVLFVSHNLVAIEKLCKSSVLLQDGRMVSMGVTQEVIDTYQDRHNLTSFGASVDQYRTHGKEKKIIKRIRSLSKDLEEQHKFNISDDVVIEIQLLRKIYASENPHIGIGINRLNDDRILTLMSYNGIDQKRWSDSSVIRCHISNLNLMPGLFSLKISISINGIEEDVIKDYPGFEIVAHDYFGSGKLLNDSQGLIVKDARWSYLDE